MEDSLGHRATEAGCHVITPSGLAVECPLPQERKHGRPRFVGMTVRAAGPLQYEQPARDAALPARLRALGGTLSRVILEPEFTRLFPEASVSPWAGGPIHACEPLGSPACGGRAPASCISPELDGLSSRRFCL